MDHQRIYDLLIDRAKTRTDLPGYTESHHIIPTCIGGPDIIENKVGLSAREHFIAHLLLAKIHGGSLWYASFMMSNMKKYNSRKYKWVKEHQTAEMRNNNPNKDGKYSKAAWAKASPQRKEEIKDRLKESWTIDQNRREKQARIMAETNKLYKSKPKEIRLYECPTCKEQLEKLEFCHQPKKKERFCGRACSAKMNNKRRLENKQSTAPRLKKKNIPKTKKPHPWTLSGRVAWNKGQSNPASAENGKKSAAKNAETAIGRKIIVQDGKRRWAYPDGDRWFIKDDGEKTFLPEGLFG